MTRQALLACAVLLAAAARADDLRLSASCDDGGNLSLHGEGPFASGETVDVRLLHVVGSSREYKSGKQVLSNARSFDAVIEPGDLPPGDYVVEVRVAGLAAAVGVQLTSLRGIEEERGEEEKTLLAWYRRLRAEEKGLEQVLQVVDQDARASKLRAWEKGTSAIAKEIGRKETPQIPAARQALADLAVFLVVLSKVNRGADDEEIGDLLKKQMVANADGTPRDAGEVFEKSRREFAGALADAFAGVMRRSTEELDRALARVKDRKKDFEPFRASVSVWAARVSKSCDRERGIVAPEGPYPAPVGDAAGQLRSTLRDLAEAYIATFDKDAVGDTFNQITTLKQRTERLLTQIAEEARK